MQLLTGLGCVGSKCVSTPTVLITVSPALQDANCVYANANTIEQGGSYLTTKKYSEESPSPADAPDCTERTTLRLYQAQQ